MNAVLATSPATTPDPSFLLGAGARRTGHDDPPRPPDPHLSLPSETSPPPPRTAAPAHIASSA
jgi:hypothetical protein